MVGAFGGLGLFSIIFIRQKAFELFYYTHLLSLILLGVGAAKHGATGVFVGLAFTGLDFAMRFCRMRKVTLTITRLPAGVTRIEFPREQWHYSAGQYAFVCIPKLGVQFHPFSLSSAPNSPNVMLHVRALGGWTNSLRELSVKGQVEGPVQCTAYIEGPYGALSVNLHDPKKYNIVLLISGGT
jgi:predicted ferric reductase